MTLSLDHVVIAVADLDQAVADYAALGFTVLPGGQHGGGVTHNALVVFEDGAYLELIAFLRADPDNRWWRVYDRGGEGFLDYALLPSEIEADVAAAQSRGLDIEMRPPGERLRPDGQRVAWKTARSPQADVPFLCGDVTPRNLRVQEGDVRRHPNGVTGIAEVAVAVEDLAESRRRYEAYLGTPAQDSGRTFRLGATTLRLSPRDDGAEVARALDARGERPWALVLAGKGPARDLDPSQTHGARIAIAPG